VSGPPAPGSCALVLVRHGEARCNVEGLVGGPRGCLGLTPRGREQVGLLARHLARTGELRAAGALYSSPLPRAQQTAGLLAPVVGPGDLPMRLAGALAELHPGPLDGHRWDEVVRTREVPDWDQDPDRPLAPGAESWSAFVVRAVAGLEALARQHPGTTVVACCHAGVIEAAMVTWLGSRRRRLGLPVAHASLTWFEQRNGAWVLVRFNDVSAQAPLLWPPAESSDRERQRPRASLQRP